MSKSLNLSPVSYQTWLTLVFNHPASDAGWYWQEGVDFHVSNRTRLVAHFTRMCREFASVANLYAIEQIDEGIRFLLGARTQFGEFLVDETIAIDERLECVRAMLGVYANFVAPSSIMMPTCFEMWWHQVCRDVWSVPLWRVKGDEIWSQMEQNDGEVTKIDINWNDLSVDETRVMDVILDTLVDILNLDEVRCETFALHGLNHLNHPARVATVQHFIDDRRDELDEETLAWVEECRDGTAM